MIRFTQILGLVLLSTLGSAEPQAVPEYEQEPQPGVLRLSGIEENDRVLLDGELIGDGKRIARFGSKLLINPGEYKVTVISSSPRNSCESHVSIRENRISDVRCLRPSADPFVD